MTTVPRTSGVFSATGQSAEVRGYGVSFALTFAGAATVTLEYYDDGLAAWTTARSYTATPANPPVQIPDVAYRRWRLNCTAHTGDVTYSMIGGG